MPPTTARLMQPLASAGIVMPAIAIATAQQINVFMCFKLLFGQLRAAPTIRSGTWDAIAGLSTGLVGERFGPDLCDGHCRRDGLRIDGETNDGGLAGSLGLLERLRKILGAVNRNAEATEGACKGRKIWIAQFGRGNAA